ncbi:anthranilate phosphoribosyltransferase [soil metagenome]
MLAVLAEGRTLNEEQAFTFMRACLNGEPTPAQVAAALTALRVRGETTEEITAFARAMRCAALTFDPGFEVIDTCGTGGDGFHTFNISTAAAFVAAGAGAKVAKHGSRALSSRSGSSDVLSALGVRVEARPDQAREALEQAGVCFLFAPAFNPAMRHVTPIRAELGFRTVFNLLGPLANPAGAKRQLVGVYDPARVEPLARVLGALGADHAWVVHGSGLDEITTTGATTVAAWKQGRLERFTLSPSDVGLPVVDASALRGGEPAENADALKAMLDGRSGPYADIVLFNAAASLVIADLATDLPQGMALARESVASGQARAALDRLVALSQD